MDDFLTVMIAVLAGNLWACLFIWGLYRASRIRDDGIDMATCGALVLPIGVAVSGVYLFT